ncbi:MAG: helix-turn-helix domain-containing protein [Pseudomonadota bacterium]
MTPFGLKMHELRAQKGVSQKQMAEEIGVSAAYLSALEHGKRGAPSWQLLQRVIGYFNVIWDEAEELQDIAAASHTRVVVDTTQLSANATRLANQLAKDIGDLSESDCRVLISEIKRRSN